MREGGKESKRGIEIGTREKEGQGKVRKRGRERGSTRRTQEKGRE